MIGHLLRMFERPVVGQVIGDAGSPHRVVADLGCDAGLFRPPLDHPVRVGLPHPMRRASGPARGPEQGPVGIAPNAGGG